MATLLAWPAFASIAAGLGTLGLVGYVRRYRGKPGTRWFLASLGGQALWCLAYGVGLLVADGTLRWVIEHVVWLGMFVTGITFLGFGLAYTGRSGLLRSWWYRLFLLATVGLGALVVTNPLHHLIWTGYRAAPVGGLATVAYEFQPLAYLAIGGGLIAVLLGSLLLFDTVVSYGRLYRSEAVAVGLSTLPPAVGLGLWLFEVGPFPQLNLATVLFLPHVALDAYAFVGSDMFEFHPATRRVAERAAIEDLGSPVVIVDERERVVTLNGAAADLFGVTKAAVKTRPLADVLGEGTVEPGAGEQVVELRADGRREFRVTPAPLRDAEGTHLGYTLVFQDVTSERRREQRLEVLNRILRHNLRNDLNVVGLSVDQAAEDVDAETATHLERAREAADRLASVGEKARDVEAALDAEGAPSRSVDVGSLVDHVAADVATAHPDAVVETHCKAESRIETDPDLLEVVLANLVETGVVHDGDRPRVRVTVRETTDWTDVGGDTRTRPADGGGAVEIVVADDGRGIPDHELSVLASGTESDLHHGSGLGLWLVHWGVRRLGGTVDFSVDDGTTATVVLPR